MKKKKEKKLKTLKRLQKIVIYLFISFPPLLFIAKCKLVREIASKPIKILPQIKLDYLFF